MKQSQWQTEQKIASLEQKVNGKCIKINKIELKNSEWSGPTKSAGTNFPVPGEIWPENLFSFGAYFCVFIYFIFGHSHAANDDE